MAERTIVTLAELRTMTTDDLIEIKEPLFITECHGCRCRPVAVLVPYESFLAVQNTMRNFERALNSLDATKGQR